MKYILGQQVSFTHIIARKPSSVKCEEVVRCFHNGHEDVFEDKLANLGIQRVLDVPGRGIIASVRPLDRCVWRIPLKKPLDGIIVRKTTISAGNLQPEDEDGIEYDQKTLNIVSTISIYAIAFNINRLPFMALPSDITALDITQPTKEATSCDNAE